MLCTMMFLANRCEKSSFSDKHCFRTIIIIVSLLSHSRIYWTTIGDKKVYSSRVDGSDRKELEGLTTLKSSGITIDSTGE